MTKRRSINGVAVAAVRPNVSVRVAYRDRLYAMIEEMQRSMVYWIAASYRANQPRIVAVDANPAKELQKAFDKASKRWLKKFEEASDSLGAWFAQKTQDRSDVAMKAILRKAGFTVKFNMTPEMQTIMDATIEQQVGLIRSIAKEHLAGVQGLVMRSVQQGRDIKWLSDQLQERYGVTQRRANFIAHDQNNKATAAMTRARQFEIGAEEAIWQHSGAGKHPRPEHVAFSKGTHSGGNPGPVYKISKGAYLEGKWTWPGVEINCGCVSKTIIPGLRKDNLRDAKIVAESQWQKK